jgi:hypothetical protein
MHGSIPVVGVAVFSRYICNYSNIGTMILIMRHANTVIIECAGRLPDFITFTKESYI